MAKQQVINKIIKVPDIFRSIKFVRFIYLEVSSLKNANLRSFRDPMKIHRPKLRVNKTSELQTSQKSSGYINRKNYFICVEISLNVTVAISR